MPEESAPDPESCPECGLECEPECKDVGVKRRGTEIAIPLDAVPRSKILGCTLTACVAAFVLDLFVITMANGFGPIGLHLCGGIVMAISYWAGWYGGVVCFTPLEELAFAPESLTCVFYWGSSIVLQGLLLGFSDLTREPDTFVPAQTACECRSGRARVAVVCAAARRK